MDTARASRLTQTALGAAITIGEIHLSHDGASFGNKMMRWPIAVVPVAIPAGAAAVFSRRAARTVLPLASVAIVANGLQGTYLHWRGVKQRPGGITRYNLESGPPGVGIAAGWSAMHRAGRNLGTRGTVMQALSAVDIAWWDLKARLLNVALGTLTAATRSGRPAGSARRWTAPGPGASDDRRARIPVAPDHPWSTRPEAMPGNASRREPAPDGTLTCGRAPEPVNRVGGPAEAPPPAGRVGTANTQEALIPF
ncbi:hypothetical protein [Frankia gtarii]|uniref:hypothetical protein n=1 Tax=Frankia gtarii TaxID=2950102 RepID=UPI0021BFFEB8|nr:hypothetical protein [Frankia gtarii]